MSNVAQTTTTTVDSNTSQKHVNTTSTSNTTPAASTNAGIFSAPEYTRLVTIAAHVDHGKTTLADNLIEANGLISERLAGTIRYLDSDPEEQRRGITMRSSAIGLSHYYTPPPTTIASKDKDKKQHQQKMIVHLVDSPGHTDFAREVSNSMILCDSVLLVVDVVEGMTPRTQQVFRETETYSLVPILILNKIDRLYTHLGLSSTEAYIRLRTLLETINAAAASMIHSSYLLRCQSQSQSQSSPSKSEWTAMDDLLAYKEQQEKIWTFDPANGNVIFASAYYGWGFTTMSVCKSLYRNQYVPIKPIQLKQCLFGDYRYNPETQKIVKWKQHAHADQLPLFAQYAIQPIWDVYEGIAIAASSIGLSPLSSMSSSNNNTTTAVTKDNKKSTTTSSTSTTTNRIRADTIGMDQVLHALQIGGTAATNAQSKETTSKTSATTTSSTISTIEELQTILTSTGSGSSEETTSRTILRRYRPLAICTLDTICEKCPSPIMAAQQLRCNILTTTTSRTAMESSETSDSNIDIVPSNNVRIKNSIRDCSIDIHGPCVAFVCKFLSTDPLQIRDSELALQLSTASSNNINNNSNSNNNVLLGVTRVLCGRLRSGTSYYIIGPSTKGHHQHYEQVQQEQLPISRTIRLYLLMGSSFLHVPEVPAGHLCAVYFGFDDIQYKSATISNDRHCFPVRGFDSNSYIRPLVKVSIEPVVTSDIEYLERGLTKLALADASVEVTATDKGERLLACLGELHLEQSILDLERTYCGKEGIKLRVSDPIVDFAESTVWFDSNETENFSAFYDDQSPILRQATIPPYNEEEGIAYARNGRMRTILSGRGAAICVRAIPLAASIYNSLQSKKIPSDDPEWNDEIRLIGRTLHYENMSEDGIFAELMKSLYVLNSTGSGMIGSIGLRDASCVVGVIADEVHLPQLHTSKHPSEYSEDTNNESPVSMAAIEGFEKLKSRIRNGASHSTLNDDTTNTKLDADMIAKDTWSKSMRGSISAGFETAMSAGPICEEPVRNVLVVIEGVEVAVTKSSTGDTNLYHASKSITGGMVVSSIRTGIRCALLSRPTRLMEGHLRLTLHSSLAGLGSLYQVLSKRRGKVVEDSMVDGTDLLLITALIPQAEAFGLTPELFAKTSGEVTAPEMVFSHWERLDVDPFWIPTSEEEREDYGELLVAGDSSTGLDNTAVQYIRQVRKRKGLIVDSSRIVQNAEKQRTLKR